MPKAAKPRSKPSKKKRSLGSPPCVNIYSTGSRSSKSPPPETTTHKMLADLLDWHPKTLVEKEGGGPGTRPPAFYDMHLDDELILKNLVYLPSMEKSLKDKVNGYLYSAEGIPIELPLSSGFYDRRRLRGAERDVSSEVLAEADVQSLYMRTTATFLSSVASSLALKLPDWNNRFFTWEATATKSVNRSQAVGDGFLKIQVEDKPKIPSATFKTLQTIQKWFPNTAIWEFKNLTAGAKHHLQNIYRLSQQDSSFPWVRCPGGHECPRHFDKNTGRAAVTGARMGPDAVDPVICMTANPNDEYPAVKPWTTDKHDVEDRKHVIHLLQQVRTITGRTWNMSTDRMSHRSGQKLRDKM